MLSRIIKRTYHKVIVEHFNNPKNIGTLDPKDPSVGTGLVGAPACGDVIKLQIKVDEHDNIIDSKCKIFGCLAGNVRISTPDGYKKIKDCNIGDDIWAWNGEKIVKNQIEAIYVHYVPKEELMYLQFEGSPYFKFICTKSHIWWKSNDTPVEAETLNLGDECFHMTENELRSLNNIGRKSDELKKKNSIRMKELNKTLDRSKLPQSTKGYVPKNPEQSKLNKSIAAKNIWKTEEYRKNWQEGMNKINWSNRPTKLELKFIDLFKENNIDVKYCGNNSLWINGCNPDFIVNGQNKVIEVFTSDMPEFMQNRKGNDWKIPRIKKFEDAGYKCLFLDLNNIDTAIHDTQIFIHNGIKVIRKETELTHNLLRDIEKNDQGLYKVYDIKCKEGANVFFAGRVASHNCGSAIANTSFASELIKGKTLTEVSQITNMDIAKATHSNQIKLHCSSLAADAIKAAVDDLKKKRGSNL